MVKIKIENRQDELVKKISKEYGIDYRICKAIVDSPFLYLKYLVTHDSIEDGIRIPYFGVFCQKGNYKNKTMRTKTRKDILLDNIEEVTRMMVSIKGFVAPSIESAKKIIEDAWELGDYEKLNFIWEGWVEFNGSK